jgi:glycosyltransferase involved in cell wall biosynthesis
MKSPTKDDGRIRVLRIAHSSLTPALRERERALVRRHPDIDLQVICTPRWREAEIDVNAQPDDLFPVITARRLFSKHPQLFAYDPWPIIKALRSHRPHLIDLSHEAYSVACAELLTLFSLFAPKVPIVMQTNQNIHHKYPPPFNWLEQRGFRRIAATYVCSETVREVVRAKGCDKPAPLITFGVNLKDFQPPKKARPRDRNFTIGFFGRMLPGKGLNILGEALQKIRSEDWQILLVGDGPERAAFEQQLADYNLSNRARFTGSIHYQFVPPYFHEIDLLVIPTETTARIREQFGRVIVEAMASEVPVIGSTCGAIPEVIGDAGLVVPEGDVDALAEALRKMISDESLRAPLAKAGRERVVRLYSWDKVGDDTYQLFREVLAATPERDLNPEFEFASSEMFIRSEIK